MNFTYLSQFPEFKKLQDYCSEVESFVESHPNISTTSARKAMEFIVKFIYTSLMGQDYGFTVFEMVTDVRFTGYVNDPILISSIHYIRKLGNVAVHNGSITKAEAYKVLEELHFLVGEFCILLGLVDDYPVFEKPGVQAPAAPAPKQEAKVTIAPELVAKFAPRMRQARFNTKAKRDEKENQKLFLEASLREAGWPIANIQNQAMPCAAGLQMMLDSGDTVDYILYGRDNKPLAIVEYTTTTQNLIEGRQKGIAKAEELAVKFGYKPIVYYTNGYHIYIIDQLGYRPRRVFQFHTLEELELLKLRAGIRQDITAPAVDENIAGREYQKQAITAACNAFASNRRHSLLIMATGTGKTRVSIALTDVLMKANWVKNILFLADRTSLVRQAHKNFNKLLPNVTTSIYAGSGFQRDPNARMIFSTYQTMINLINDDTREFSIGRFDLIIIDEAHRSIFKKYSALFHYFDALMLGLTATPRAEDNKSTYQMFELQNGNPDYAYELEQAIADGYLVGFTVLDKTTDALRRGIHYDDLSGEEKERFEDTFATGDEEVEFSGTVLDAKTLSKSNYVHLGTIDAMLNDLMKNGLKVDGGDKLGKTIIFAGNHLEATYIVERFQKLYPHLGMDFCKLIDCQVPNHLNLIDTFEVRENMPQIAVSVDMMDTGIDVPDILNLVFFKKIESKIKFLQMIGRGTRLSADIYGPDMDKQGFLIFDYYDNFRYFNTNNTWSTKNDQKQYHYTILPQSILIHKRKLNILRNLIEKDARTPFEDAYIAELKAYFIDAVQNLCNDDLEVQYHMAIVSKYRTAEQWDGFTNEKIDEICDHIIPLLPAESASMKVKTFDLMIYTIEDEVQTRMDEGKDIRKIRYGFGNIGNKLDAIMEALLKLKTIPAVVAQEPLINKMRNGDYLFENFSVEKCEQVRKTLRELMPFIPTDKRYYIIDATDFVIDSGNETVVKEKTYVQRVQEYLRGNTPALAKLSNLDELTAEEKQELEEVFTVKLGSAADYAAWSGNKPLLPFLRMQLGISEAAIQTKFGSFLNDTVLDEQQLIYMNQIIQYTRENGDIVFMDLQRVSPFCDINVVDLFGPNIKYIKELVNGLHRPVM